MIMEKIIFTKKNNHDTIVLIIICHKIFIHIILFCVEFEYHYMLLVASSGYRNNHENKAHYKISDRLLLIKLPINAYKNDKQYYFISEMINT